MDRIVQGFAQVAVAILASFGPDAPLKAAN
jgi:hypothetical protein